jgi:hypothetical protein
MRRTCRGRPRTIATPQGAYRATASEVLPTKTRLRRPNPRAPSAIHVGPRLLRNMYDLYSRVAQRDDRLDIGPPLPEDLRRPLASLASLRDHTVPQLPHGLSIARRLRERRHRQRGHLGVRWQWTISQPSTRPPRIVRSIARQQNPHVTRLLSPSRLRGMVLDAPS